MKKIVLWVFFLAAIVATAAWAQGKYVRKNVRPNFFVPEQEFTQQKAKPRVPLLKNRGVQGHNSKTIVAQDSISQPVPTTEKEEKKDIGELGIIGQPGFRNLKMDEPIADVKAKPEEVPAPEEKNYTPEDGLGDGLINDTIYRERMDVYERDLLTISKTGKMPQNDQLKSDLDVMNSNLSFSVE